MGISSDIISSDTIYEGAIRKEEKKLRSLDKRALEKEWGKIFVQGCGDQTDGVFCSPVRSDVVSTKIHAEQRGTNIDNATHLLEP